MVSIQQDIEGMDCLGAVTYLAALALQRVFLILIVLARVLAFLLAVFRVLLDMPKPMR